MCAGIRAYSNGGSLDYTRKGNVKVLPKIKAYVNGNSLANIVGFCDLVDHYMTLAMAITFLYMSQTLRECGSGVYQMDYMVLIQKQIN